MSYGTASAILLRKKKGEEYEQHSNGLKEDGVKRKVWRSSCTRRRTRSARDIGISQKPFAIAWRNVSHV